MTYSIIVSGASKAEAKAAVAARLAEVVASQSVHDIDRAQALAAAESFIDLLPDDDTMDVTATVSGWVQWRGQLGVNHFFVGAQCSVSACLSERIAQ